MTHTDTQAALLSAICADPSDMTARLVYADTCEECGDMARAEFVRTQIELSKPLRCEWMTRGLACKEYNADVQQYRVMVTCPACSERVRLNTRERELWASAADNAMQLDEPIWGIFPEWHIAGWSPNELHYVNLRPESHPEFHALFQRGFVESITTTCQSWATHGPQIVTQTPVTQVRLVDREASHIKIGGSGYGTKYGAVWFSSDAISKAGFIGGSSHPLSNSSTVPAGWMDGKRRMNYKTGEEANEWLYRRALQWARATAGLPRWEMR